MCILNIEYSQFYPWNHLHCTDEETGLGSLNNYPEATLPIRKQQKPKLLCFLTWCSFHHFTIAL